MNTLGRHAESSDDNAIAHEQTPATSAKLLSAPTTGRHYEPPAGLVATLLLAVPSIGPCLTAVHATAGLRLSHSSLDQPPRTSPLTEWSDRAPTCQRVMLATGAKAKAPGRGDGEALLQESLSVAAKTGRSNRRGYARSSSTRRCSPRTCCSPSTRGFST
jgi:hypothetical protein